MTTSAHKTALSKHTKNECFYPLVFTGKKDSPSTCPKSEGLFGSRLTSPQDLLTRYYNFGARYYDSDLSGLFLSVDPMADKYPSISPYHYCNWNPVIVKDPSGNDGIKIVDKDRKHITVKANYYVNSIPIPGVEGSCYSADDIMSMQKTINSTLNNQKYSFQDGDAIYSVSFDLTFIPSGDLWQAEHLAENDPIGNVFTVMPEKYALNIFRVIDNKDGTESHNGGKTFNNNTIYMNYDYENKRDRIHEIFHTLYFDNDNADNGIGNYYPGTDLPNQNDIKMLLSNPDLPEKTL